MVFICQRGRERLRGFFCGVLAHCCFVSVLSGTHCGSSNDQNRSIRPAALQADYPYTIAQVCFLGTVVKCARLSVSSLLPAGILHEPLAVPSCPIRQVLPFFLTLSCCPGCVAGHPIWALACVHEPGPSQWLPSSRVHSPSDCVCAVCLLVLCPNRYSRVSHVIFLCFRRDLKLFCSSAGLATKVLSTALRTPWISLQFFADWKRV